MFLTNFYLLSFTIFLAIILRGMSKQYDIYDMKEDRPMLDSAQIMNLLHETDHKPTVQTVTPTFQLHLMPATLRLKNINVDDTITPGTYC